jgi:hypothetical protein
VRLALLLQLLAGSDRCCLNPGHCCLNPGTVGLLLLLAGSAPVLGYCSLYPDLPAVNPPPLLLLMMMRMGQLLTQQGLLLLLLLLLGCRCLCRSQRALCLRWQR